MDQDNTLTQERVAALLPLYEPIVFQWSKAMGLVEKLSKWIPYELAEGAQKAPLACSSSRDQLNRVVIGGEKWILLVNPTREKFRVEPGGAYRLLASPAQFAKRSHASCLVRADHL